MGLEVAAQVVGAGPKFVDLIADHDAVVDLAKRVPLQAAIGDRVENGTHRLPGREIPEVMHADVPFVARATKHVRISARRVMALQDEHALSAVAGEQRRGAKSANSGADYYRVVRAARVIALVRFGDFASS